MNCPRCARAVLEEHDRDGIIVDACRTCRGIWLDRGELERMIARAMRDFEELERPAPERREAPGALLRRERHRDDKDDDHRGWGRDERYPKRRKRWLETLGDIFD